MIVTVTAAIVSFLLVEVDGDFARVTSNETDTAVMVGEYLVEPNVGWVCVADPVTDDERWAGFVPLPRIT